MGKKDDAEDGWDYLLKNKLINTREIDGIKKKWETMYPAGSVEDYLAKKPRSYPVEKNSGWVFWEMVQLPVKEIPECKRCVADTKIFFLRD